MIGTVIILLLICCCNVIVSDVFQHYTVFLHYLPHIFSQDGVNVRCVPTPTLPTSNADSAAFVDLSAESVPIVEIEDYETCRLRTVKNMRSVRKAEMFAILQNSLIPVIEAQLVQFVKPEELPIPKLGTYVEGNILGFQDKIDVLQEYADDPHVETVCEIGFNAGYSASLWLLNNPNTQLFAFDVFYHNYSGVAVSAVHHIFGGRKMMGIAGDSNTSVINFHNMYPSQKCNIIFIDGGHAKESLRSDIEVMRFLANESYHRVIVDDVDEPTSEFGVLSTEYWQFVGEIGEDPRPNDPLLKHIPLADTPVLANADGTTTVGVEKDDVLREVKLRHFHHYLVDAIPKPQLTWTVNHSPTHLLDSYAEFEVHSRNVPDGITENFMYSGRSGITVAEYIF